MLGPTNITYDPHCDEVTGSILGGVFDFFDGITPNMDGPVLAAFLKQLKVDAFHKSYRTEVVIL
jgi:hypothetical protein